jgi:hypothetical protein
MIVKKDLFDALKIIDKEFHGDILEEFNIDETKAQIKAFSEKHFSPNKRMAVLGLDIYKYSDYEENKQNLIPFIFDLILDETSKHIKQTERPFFLENFDVRKNFISTGDGGFILFDTPLHGLIFNMHFFAVLHLFNTGHFFPKLSIYIGNIIIRSAITFDRIFNYENNYYGKAIINNSRILNKDRLNRFIIDENVFNYFNKYFNGIESLPIISFDSIKRALKINIGMDTAFFRMEQNNDSIKSVHIQKIEEMYSKDTKLLLYNEKYNITFQLGMILLKMKKLHIF